jgi:hypothetical protein
VLDLADVVRVPPAFSPAEQDRAHATAARDPRLRAALESAGYGLTQTLAAAPQLVARWEDAQTAAPYAWAVLTAALDVARLGARAPLSADFLRALSAGGSAPRRQHCRRHPPAAAGSARPRPGSPQRRSRADPARSAGGVQGEPSRDHRPFRDLLAAGADSRPHRSWPGFT